MRTILFRSLVIFLTLAVLILSGVALFLDSRLKHNLREGLGELLGQRVEIEGSEIGLLTGKGSVTNLSIPSSEVVNLQEVLGVPKVTFDTNPFAALRKTVRVDKAVIDSPVINLVLKEDNHSLAGIRDRLESRAAQGPDPGDRRILIRELEIRNLTLNVIVDRTFYTFACPNIIVSGLVVGPGGQGMAQVLLDGVRSVENAAGQGMRLAGRSGMMDLRLSPQDFRPPPGHATGATKALSPSPEAGPDGVTPESGEGREASSLLDYTRNP